MKIVFFGLGTVAGVMATCLFELYEKNGTEVEFLFVVRSRKKSREELLNKPKLLKCAEFLEVEDFINIFNHPGKYPKLAGADALINSSLPAFNLPILKLAEKMSANYADFASDMYNKKTLATFDFEQEDYGGKMARKKLFGLINIGVSPGITNFMIGEKITEMQKFAPESYPKSVNIYLLEDISAREIFFSWSPATALSELEEYPRYFENGVLKKMAPFSSHRSVEFPFREDKIDQYPIFQEEVLSLRKSFPKLDNIKIFTGGSEVELIKNLYQLNLLSKRHIDCLNEGISVEKLVRLALPRMAKPRVIEKAVRNGVISRAQFAAVAEINFKIKNPSGSRTSTVTEKIGLSFHRYIELKGTPYSGTTYIGYTTGVGAAILFYYTFKAWKKSQKKFSGILHAEELPLLLGVSGTGKIKRELSNYKFAFSSTEQTY